MAQLSNSLSGSVLKFNPDVGWDCNRKSQFQDGSVTLLAVGGVCWQGVSVPPHIGTLSGLLVDPHDVAAGPSQTRQSQEA